MYVILGDVCIYTYISGIPDSGLASLERGAFGEGGVLSAIFFPFLSVPCQDEKGQECYFWRMDKSCFISLQKEHGAEPGLWAGPLL